MADRSSAINALRIAAVVETCTGLALMVGPVAFGWLLLGVEVSGVAGLMARLFGVSLCCLGISCWPEAGVATLPTVRAMLLYNVAIAAILTYLAVVAHYRAPLLTVAILLHAMVATWLAAGYLKTAP